MLVGNEKKVFKHVSPTLKTVAKIQEQNTATINKLAIIKEKIPFGQNVRRESSG